MSYIEREALLKNSHTYSMEFGEYLGDDVRDVDAILTDRVKEAPAADVAPVVHGRWLWHEEWNESTPDNPAECQSSGYKCSMCGIDLADYLQAALRETVYLDNADNPPKIKRCPSCGCKMDGGEKRERAKANRCK